MKKIIFIIVMLSGINAFAQSDYERSTDKENNAVVLKGQVTFDDLMKEKSFDWLQKGSTDYSPESAAAAFLKNELPAYEVVVFLGTWCDDSKQIIPKLHKTLQAVEYPMRRLSMYGVDRAKTTKYVEHKLYKIEFVPTIILFKKNSEVGRIVESTKASVEQDLVDIIKKDKATIK